MATSDCETWLEKVNMIILANNSEIIRHSVLYSILTKLTHTMAIQKMTVVGGLSTVRYDYLLTKSSAIILLWEWA